MDVFQNLIAPELSGPPTGMLPASCIRFIITFRNQFQKQHYAHVLPMLLQQLASQDIVVHTYAAAAIERILTVKDAGGKELVFGRADLQPHLQALFGGLFGIIESDNAENEYVMKCVMRSLAVIAEDVKPVTEMIMSKLTAALGLVCKNPSNPRYNHFLFESIAVLVRNVCSTSPEAVAAFEPLLFPPFQTVLQMEVTEFIPYVFQVLAQLLEYRAPGEALSASYTGLFAPLLTPTLWESKGNVPALTRLIVAYVNKGGVPLLSSGNNLMGVLGVFQKLISSKANEASGFLVITGLLEHLGIDTLKEQVPQVFQILMMRLQSAKTAKFCRLMTLFISFFVAKFGAKAFLGLMNGIQPGLGVMVLGPVFAKTIVVDGAVYNKLDTKTIVLGITALLEEAEIVQGGMESGSLWGNLVVAVCKLMHAAGVEKNDNFEDPADAQIEVQFDSAFSKLNFAGAVAVDKFSATPDFAAAFVQKLSALCAAQPGSLLALANGELDKVDNGKYKTVLQEVCGKYGVNSLM
ncbi:hypothetical protein TeGR_g12222 [Tetraparma gracilis]|uniref:Uncharacterized protein n=1 Tax=Tetraparma gracilis TaxID=2962635 RepID=A0ABQ6MPQ8_9STRA|nr:hypothetical protein TeGR_g12222 [Tetraparma gracilis]